MEPGVRQLDLSKCGPGFVSDRVGVVSGLRSSAGKLVIPPEPLSPASIMPVQPHDI